MVLVTDSHKKQIDLVDTIGVKTRLSETYSRNDSQSGNSFEPLAKCVD